MPEWLLIITPLLALGAVLLLGYSGCDFNPREVESDPSTLTFRARVPNTLEVLAPGVRFFWTRPGATLEETADVAAPSATDGAINVFDAAVPSPEVGAWAGRCQLEAQEGGVPMGATPASLMFEIPEESANYVLLFETEGSPLSPPFRVIVRGLTP